MVNDRPEVWMRFKVNTLLEWLVLFDDLCRITCNYVMCKPRLSICHCFRGWMGLWEAILGGRPWTISMLRTPKWVFLTLVILLWLFEDIPHFIISVILWLKARDNLWSYSTWWETWCEPGSFLLEATQLTTSLMLPFMWSFDIQFTCTFV